MVWELGSKNQIVNSAGVRRRSVLEQTNLLLWHELLGHKLLWMLLRLAPIYRRNLTEKVFS